MPGFGRFGRPGKPVAVAAGIVIVLIVAWVVVARLSASFSDRYESFYASLAEAEKDGAITRGWIPDEFLPRSSRSIHEVHDLSPSTEWCAFEFAPTDSQNLLSKLKHVEVLPPPLRHVPRPGVAWWPSVLVGDLDVEQIHKSDFDLYFVERPLTSVSTGYWLFAINWKTGRGFFYFT
jgi:hypothetical protein